MIDRIEAFGEVLEAKIPHQIGYLYNLLSNFLFSIAAFLVRKFRGIPSFQVFHIRGLHILFFSFLFMDRSKVYSTDKKTTQLLIIRGAMGIFVGSFTYYGFQRAPLGEGMAVFLTAPVITGLMGYVILGEAYDWTQTVNTILSFGGVVLITQPEFVFGLKPGAEPKEKTGLIFIFLGSIF